MDAAVAFSDTSQLEVHMKIRSIGNCLLLFGGLGLLWSGNPRQLRAGQNYPSHVTVFGQSTKPSAPTAPTPKIDPAKEADIRELMDTLEVKEMATKMMTNMANNLKPLLLHSFPPGAYRERLVHLFYEKFEEKVSAQKLLDLAVPIYARYLSDDDIKGLIQFYKTPLGQRWLKVRPKLQATLGPEARQWGQKLGREAMMEVLQEHPDLARQLNQAVQAAHQH